MAGVQPTIHIILKSLLTTTPYQNSRYIYFFSNDTYDPALFPAISFLFKDIEVAFTRDDRADPDFLTLWYVQYEGFATAVWAAWRYIALYTCCLRHRAHHLLRGCKPTTTTAIKVVETNIIFLHIK